MLASSAVAEQPPVTHDDFVASLESRVKCLPEDPDKCVVVLNKDDMAPFNGHLMTPKLATALSLKANSVDEVLEIETRRIKGEYDIQLSLAKKIHAIDVEAEKMKAQLWEKTAEDLQKKLDEAHPWYREPWFVAAVTAAAVVGVIYGSAYIVGEIRQDIVVNSN